MTPVLAFLFAVAVTLPAAAQEIRTKAEGVSFALPLPAGHCRLERGHRVDRVIVRAVERLAAKSNRVLAGFADCAERDAFRAGTQKYLDNFGQYMMPRKDARTKLAPADFARQMAEYFKKQGADVFQGAEADTRERIGVLRLGIGIGETRRLGVLRTDERASYLGLVQNLKTDDGSTKLQVGVVAFGVVKGRIVTLNLFSRFAEGPIGAETTMKLLEKAAQTFSALTDANRR
jgi:hypothetical protein